MRVYYQECAPLYPEPECRSAFRAAAAATKHEEQLPLAFAGCRKAYCPILHAENLEACTSDLPATPDALDRAWPPLNRAILNYNAGSYGQRVINALYVLGTRIPPDASTPSNTAETKARTQTPQPEPRKPTKP